jgi:hypothetical protein
MIALTAEFDIGFFHQRPTAHHHSTTKVQLKCPTGNGLYSFPVVFFWYFFGQAKKYIRSLPTIESFA